MQKITFDHTVIRPRQFLTYILLVLEYSFGMTEDWGMGRTTISSKVIERFSSS